MNRGKKVELLVNMQEATPDSFGCIRKTKRTDIRFREGQEMVHQSRMPSTLKLHPQHKSHTTKQIR